MPITINLGYLTHQGVALLVSGLIACAALGLLRLPGRLRGRTRGLPAQDRHPVLRVVAELVLVCLLEGMVGLEADRIGLAGLLPGYCHPLVFLAIGLMFYWLVVWWPLWVLVLMRKRLTGARASKVVRALAVASPVIACYACFVEPNWIATQHVPLTHADVRGAEIRIVHISDLQLVDFGLRERELIERVEAFHPHLVIMTGDYITGSLDEQTAIAAARAVITALHPSHGVFATESDSDTIEQRKQIFAGLSARWIGNRTEVVEVEGTPVRIGLLSHAWPQWHLLRRGASPEELAIVACHTPDLLHECEARLPETDLYLCGHTHGGQVQIPWFGPPVTLVRNTPRHVAAGGVFQTARGMPYVVSRGIGMEGQYAPRFRLNCRPHLVLITFSAPARQ